MNDDPEQKKDPPKPEETPPSGETPDSLESESAPAVHASLPLEPMGGVLPPAPPPERIRAFLAAWYPHILSGAAIIGLAIVSLLLWNEWSRRFPAIPAGAYVGVIRGDAAGEQPAGFYVERMPGSSRALALILRSGWQPHLIEGLIADDQEVMDIAPVLMNGPDGGFKLIGKADGEGGFSGRVKELRSGDEGTWELLPVRERAPIPQNDREEIRLAVLLKDELAEVHDRIENTRRVVPEQRAEIEKLTEFVTEGEQLRRRADEKLKTLTEELAASRKVLAAKQAEAAALADQFDLSQRVSGMGRLVTLSRSTLEREALWVSSVLRSEPPQPSAELDRAYERAHKIHAMKREIAQEMDRILRIEQRDEPAAPPTDAAPADESDERAGIRRWMPW